MSHTELEQLQQLVQECSSVSGNELLSTFRTFASEQTELIRIIHDPFQKFGVTSRQITKHKLNPLGCLVLPRSFYDLLTGLANRQWTGNLAKSMCLGFIVHHPNYRSVIYKAIDKNLGIRMSVKSINKCFPFLIATYECALGLPWKDTTQRFFNKTTRQNKKWFVSRKFDGNRVRVVCDSNQDQITLRSRAGHVFPNTIPELGEIVRLFGAVQHNVVFDCEFVVLDAEGNENFAKANSILNPNARADGKRGKGTHSLADGDRLVCFAFDCIPLKAFNEAKGGPTLGKRLKHLADHLPHSSQIVMVDQKPHEEADDLFEEAMRKGWEGTILRLDAPYQGRKCNHIIKRKKECEVELVAECIDLSEQMVPGSTDKQTVVEHVGVTFKGNRCWVSGGLTWEQRVQFTARPDDLIGTVMTVRYNDESVDKTGKAAMRHPRIKSFHFGSDGRTV